MYSCFGYQFQPHRNTTPTMQAALLVLFLAVSAPRALDAVSQHQRMSMEVVSNPVRKVVTLLQKMQAEVTAEGKKEEDLYEKFMCYCKNSKGTLAASIEEAKEKIASLESEFKADMEKKAQTEADLKEHQGSRTAAKEAIAQASALREKENAGFKAETGDLSTNLKLFQPSREAWAAPSFRPARPTWSASS
jgi:chromosome segregation ATPase